MPKKVDLDDIIDSSDLDTLVRSPEPLADLPPMENLPANLPDMAILSPEEVAEDQICIAVKDDEVPDTVLKAIVYGFAEEQASLKNLRTSKNKEGKDTSNISLKRGMLLKYMSETLLQKQALVGVTGDLDLHSPKFREVFKMFLETISDTFDEVKIPSEFKEIFFHALSKNLEGWESKAERLIKVMNMKAAE
jgi:hypothetical protein